MVDHDGRRPGHTIEEAAALTGVSRDTLRYYERIGLLPRVARAANGHRRYTEDDLGWVRFLTLLRGTDMPIRDMSHLVELTRAGDHTIPDRLELLRHHRDGLVDRLQRMQEHLDAINHKIDIYEGRVAGSVEPEPVRVS